eukprot:CAMPEP_0119015502 /NCGR_PEP_ID=MMETSP1176-20130426/11150_1 /TAXON_ID=265551 /ORGANISM="Synedropsis recta cf, Strain CCMP1620" /LENGTH=782 /DNA_ID=CAMNT_0006968801 /DNA_START=57 /DNA_END=2405 /DNA_ORIENTATION=+
MKPLNLIVFLLFNYLSGRVLAYDFSSLLTYQYGNSLSTYQYGTPLHNRFNVTVHCTVEVIEVLYAPDGFDEDNDPDLSQLRSESEILCATKASDETDGSGGMTYPLVLSDDNYDAEDKLGQLTSEVLSLHDQGLRLSLTITHANHIRSHDMDDDRIELTPESQTTIESSTRRKLEEFSFGEKFTEKSNRTMLVVLVTATDSNWTEAGVTSASLSQSYFGTANNTVKNMNKQYSDCSNKQLTFVASTTGDGVVNGVLDLAFDGNLNGTNHTQFSNDVIVATVTALGMTAGSDPGGVLSSTYDHVVFCYPAGTLKSGKSWFAYAHKPGSSSYYNGGGCENLGGQVHEIGHNLDLHHSSQDTAEYGDTTCQMGISSNSLKCFNGAKNWYTGWFENEQADISQELPFEGNLYTYVDLAKPHAGPMLLRLKADANLGGFLYLEYNRQKDHNAGTGELGDTVTIVHTDNLQGTSYLKGSVSLYKPGFEISGYVFYACSVNANEGASADYVTMSIFESGGLTECPQCRKNYIACHGSSSQSGVTFGACKARCEVNSSCKSFSYKYDDQSCNICEKQYPDSHVSDTVESEVLAVFIDMTQTSPCAQSYGCDFNPADPALPAKSSCPTGTIEPNFVPTVTENREACSNLGALEFLASFEDCRDACGTTSGCEAFSFDSSAFNVMCNMCNSTELYSELSGATWSDLDLTETYYDPDMVSYRKNAESCHSAGHRDFVVSYDDCKQLCSDQSGCLSFAWYSSLWYGRCHFCDQLVPTAELACDGGTCSEWGRII